MPLPDPVPGLVIRYSYLWLDEHRQGQEEGAKDRPCAVILVTTGAEGERVVTVLPVTHTPPVDGNLAVEIPPATKRRLGLDETRSWVVLAEANRFIWPGPDLWPARRGDAASIAFGMLPYGLFETIRLKFLAAIRARRAPQPIASEGQDANCRSLGGVELGEFNTETSRSRRKAEPGECCLSVSTSPRLRGEVGIGARRCRVRGTVRTVSAKSPHPGPLPERGRSELGP